VKTFKFERCQIRILSHLKVIVHELTDCRGIGSNFVTFVVVKLQLQKSNALHRLLPSCVTASTVVNFIHDVWTERRRCVIVTDVKCCSLYIYELFIELLCKHCAASVDGVPDSHWFVLRHSSVILLATCP